MTSLAQPPFLQPSIVATLATGPAIADLRILLGSLALWNSPAPTVYLYCDSGVADAVRALKYPGQIHIKEALNVYSKMGRAIMERLPSRTYPNTWFEFMAQKLNLLDWAFSSATEAQTQGGILFCDADICFFGPLPLIPSGAQVALSQHEIRRHDEERFGTYNGGFLWMKSPRFVEVWRQACKKDPRFFEQACLELVGAAAGAAFYPFPRTQNYGWWRMWQGQRTPEQVQTDWTMNRNKCPNASGILISGQPLGSVHTHFLEDKDAPTMGYNRWLLSWLKKLGPAHPPAKKLMALLESAGVKIEGK